MPSPESLKQLIEFITPKPIPSSRTPDLIVEQIKEATNRYEDGFAQEAFDILDPIINEDIESLDGKGLVMYIICCIEAEKKIELFLLCSVIEEKLGYHELSYYAFAGYNYLIKKYDGAEEYLKLCIEKYPDFVHAYVLLGHIYYSVRSEYLDAMEQYLEAANRISNVEITFNCSALAKLMNTLVSEEKYICDFDVYIKSSNLFVMHELGVVLYLCKSYDLALNQYLQLLKRLTKSDLEPILSNLHYFLDEKWIDRYWYTLYLNLGYTLFFMKKYFNALACFQKLVIIGQNRYTAWKMIAACYIKLGRIYSANDALFKASVLDSNFKEFVPIL